MSAIARRAISAAPRTSSSGKLSASSICDT
jgi:hypothetical protein